MLCKFDCLTKIHDDVYTTFCQSLYLQLKKLKLSRWYNCELVCVVLFPVVRLWLSVGTGPLKVLKGTAF